MDQSIKIRIAGQEYSLKAGSPEIERLMRLAAESVSRKVEVYDSKFSDRSMVDKLAFAALNEAIGRLSCQSKLNAVLEETRKLHEETERYLENNEEV